MVMQCKTEEQRGLHRQRQLGHSVALYEESQDFVK